MKSIATVSSIEVPSFPCFPFSLVTRASVATTSLDLLLPSSLFTVRSVRYVPGSICQVCARSVPCFLPHPPMLADPTPPYSQTPPPHTTTDPPPPTCFVKL